MRTENDQWDILSSVGWSALMVAAGRAVETNRVDGLVDDPWAEVFVAAAGISPAMPTRPEQRWPDPRRVGDELTVVDEFWTLMATVQGVRSRFIDGALIDAARAGAAQVVLLAAGLDARGFRLDWPAGTTLYELDQAGVTEFKERVLAEKSARPSAERRVVSVDLRAVWVSALREAGFDPSRRSIWLAEGLLPFLPAQAQTELLRLVGTLAAPGSTVVIEDFAPVVRHMRTDPGFARFGAAFGIEMSALPDPVLDRTLPADQLAAEGWAVRTTSAVELGRQYNRPVSAISTGLVLDTRLLVGRR